MRDADHGDRPGASTQAAPLFECSIPLPEEESGTQVADAVAFRTLIRAGATDPAHRASVLVDGCHRCAYGDMVAHIESVQRLLLERGLRRGDCITVQLSNSVSSALIILAALDAGYSIVLTHAPGSDAAAGSAQVPPVHFSKMIVGVRTDCTPQAQDLSIPSTYVHVRPNPAHDPRACAPSPDRPCFFTRTSGSLGPSKIVKRVHGNYALNVRNMAARLPFDAGMRMALPTPIYHLFGLGSGLLVGLHKGVSIDLQDHPDVLYFLEREAEFDPDTAVMVPTFCEMLLRVRRRPRPYRFVLIGGDTTSHATRTRSEQLHGPLLNGYGSSEMGFIAVSDLNMGGPDGSREAGRLMPGVTLRLLLPRAAMPGEAPMGELQLKTAFRFEGYVDSDGQTIDSSASFDGEWFRTGDVARLEAGDRLQILGRSDLSIKRNGLLLPFADVEARLREVEGVEDAIVVAGREGIRGRELVAFCVLARNADLSPSEVRDRYAAGAPGYSVPDAVRLIDALPRLPSGKPDRRCLWEAAQHPEEDRALSSA